MAWNRAAPSSIIFVEVEVLRQLANFFCDRNSGLLQGKGQIPESARNLLSCLLCPAIPWPWNHSMTEEDVESVFFFKATKFNTSDCSITAKVHISSRYQDEAGITFGE